MSDDKKCFFGLHKYVTEKEIDVVSNEDGKDVVIGINIVCRCNNCGKYKATFIPSNIKFIHSI